jgi:hypothetical protein
VRPETVRITRKYGKTLGWELDWVYGERNPRQAKRL